MLIRRAILTFWLTLSGAISSRGADADAWWSSKIQPLFDVHGVQCHGPFERKSGLALDNQASVMTGGDEGSVIVPETPQASCLYTYLDADSDTHMPPKKQLTDAQRASVRDWIVSLETPSAKTDRRGMQSRHVESVSDAIDTFIAEGWKASKLKPARPANDRTWCRRVYLDLAGRIPTPIEWDNFLKSTSRSKKSDFVDRFLRSEDYVGHMREVWDVILLGRHLRDTLEDRRRQNRWWSFLERSFRTNRPWNETVHAMLVARSQAAEAKGKRLAYVG